MRRLRSHYDAAWKEIVRFLFQPLMLLCFPNIAALIDWSVAIEFLETELQSIAPRSKSRRRHVDTLVRVRYLNGQAQRILIHLEVQSQPDAEFSMRMFQYFYRLFDTYGPPIVSVAILADADPNYRPEVYEVDGAGKKCQFDYHRCKLLDFTDEFLEQSDNPVAKAILAHRIAQRTMQDPNRRMVLKLAWVRELFRFRFQEEEIRLLLKALDAMTPLPEDLSIEFRDELIHSDPKTMKPYITSFERIARKEALAEGRAEGRTEGRTEGITEGQLLALRESIRDLFEERFGFLPVGVGSRLEMESDPKVLKAWNRRVATIETPEAFLALLGISRG